MATGKKQINKVKQRNFFAYAMLAPDIIGIAVFIFLPVMVAVMVSLHSWNGLSPMEFIGLNNYKSMLGDASWWSSLWITLRFTLMYVVFLFWGALLLASFLNSLGTGPELFRTIYFIPYAISLVIGGTMWKFMLNDKAGYIASALRFLDVPLPRMLFLANTSQALPLIALVSLWQNIGYSTIIFLAAIKDIPANYIEAAKIDGAGPVKIFTRITFPLLKDVSTFILITSTIGSFQVFDQVKVMTNGGPASATSVAVFYIYKQSFDFLKLGYASSLAFALFFVIFLISLIQLKLTNANRKGD